MQAMKPKFKSKLNPKNIKIIIILMCALICLLLFSTLRDTDTILTHKQANTLFTENKIEKLIIDGQYVHIYTPTKTYKIYKDAINKDAFFSKYPIEVVEDKSYIYDILSLLLLGAAFWFMFNLIKQSKDQQLKQIHAANKVNEVENSEPIQALTSTVTFKDVAGINDVKEELEEIIDFLSDPQKYHNLDIRLPKGVLLVGPPGVGKTLISKAVAGEAGVPFFYQSGASFVHIYVGMGAKRVSELFKKAKQMAPSIIFIDEIDAVGKSRGEFRNDEREATLNQLLTEMDGFEESSGVIVIGATNKIDVLDEALLRAGRFDRRIHIALPDLEDRAKTLELYLAHKPNTVNISEVARMTVGFNSAALDTLTNEAAIFAMREGRKEIENSDFEAVKDKVLIGKQKIVSYSQKEREIQAIYQGSKAVIATWLDLKFDKIGIVNTRIIEQEHEILSKSYLVNKVKFHLAGSLATKQHYNEQFTNATVDTKKAKNLIHKIVHEYTMSENIILLKDEEDTLLQEILTDLETLIKSLDKAIIQTANYILEHENITHESCQEILREIF